MLIWWYLPPLWPQECLNEGEPHLIESVSSLSLVVRVYMLYVSLLYSFFYSLIQSSFLLIMVNITIMLLLHSFWNDHALVSFIFKLIESKKKAFDWMWTNMGVLMLLYLFITIAYASMSFFNHSDYFYGKKKNKK